MSSEIKSLKKEIQEKVALLKTTEKNTSKFEKEARELTKLQEKLCYLDCASFVEYFLMEFAAETAGKMYPIPDIHKRIYQLAESHNLVSILIPREHGKTTVVSDFFPLWMVCTGRARFVVIICENISAAISRVDVIKENLEKNQRLTARFGEFGKKVNKHWTDELTDFEILPLMAKKPHRVIIMPAGSGQSLKGMNVAGMRPDLIVMDDVFASTELQNSRDRKLKAYSWIYDAVLPLGDRAKLLNIGTIGSYDDPQMKLKESGVWETFVFGACNLNGEPYLPVPKNQEDPPEKWKFEEDGSVMLWPEARSKTWLYKKYLTYKKSGTEAEFAMNYLNQVQDKRNAMFPRVKENGELYDIYYDEDPLDLLRKRHLQVYMTIDPASSQRERADRRICMVVGVDTYEDVWYILDYHASREQVDEFMKSFAILQKKWLPRVTGIEANSMQILFYENIIEHCKANAIKINPVRLDPGNTKDGKHIRIEDTLRLRYVSGHLKFRKDHDMLLNELWSFVKFRDSGHDDAVDALSYMGQIVSTKSANRCMPVHRQVITNRPLIWK